MQPQYAAFVGTITQGDLPTEGMASLYIEVAPGNEVFRLVDIAVKSTEAKPGAQIDRGRCEALVARCFDSKDYIEGRQAFMEKRKPAFTGS